MSKMEVFQTVCVVVGVLVQVVGLLVFVFKGGEFKGTITSMLTTLTEGQHAMKEEISEHVKADIESFTEVRADIADAKISIAAIGRRGGSHA